MNYQILSLKWRPKTFAEIVDQKHVLTALINSLILGKIHNAYLFTGTRGVGKTTIARLLTKCLNCEKGITHLPCRKCKNCLSIEQGEFIDLLEIDAASRTKVEDIIELLDTIKYAPINGRYKIYLIDEVHMLSRNSFNALLKVIEETPQHIKFIFATTEVHKIPDTILSRCLQFNLKSLDIIKIINKLKYILKKEKIIYELNALYLLARAANGSMRDALTLTEHAIFLGYNIVSIVVVSNMLNITAPEYLFLLVESMIKLDANGIINYINKFTSFGIDWEKLLVDVLSILHSLVMIKQLDNKYKDENIILLPKLYNLSKYIKNDILHYYYNIILKGRKYLPYAPDRRIGVLMTLLNAIILK